LSSSLIDKHKITKKVKNIDIFDRACTFFVFYRANRHKR